jgi:hypothetical protein
MTKYRQMGNPPEMTPKEPNHYSWRDLPADPADGRKLFREMQEIQQKAGAKSWRFTVINDEFPHEIYPHGLYVEGWDEAVCGLTPFSWPTTPKERIADEPS